jgi:hypothetical protein
MLARGLELEPAVLLLDVPTSALDEMTKAAIEATLRELRDHRGRLIKTAPKNGRTRRHPAPAGRSVRPCVAYSDERSNASGLPDGPAFVFDLVLLIPTKGRTRPVSSPPRPLCSTLCCLCPRKVERSETSRWFPCRGRDPGRPRHHPPHPAPAPIAQPNPRPNPGARVSSQRGPPPPQRAPPGRRVPDLRPARRSVSPGVSRRPVVPPPSAAGHDRGGPGRPSGACQRVMAASARAPTSRST